MNRIKLPTVFDEPSPSSPDFITNFPPFLLGHLFGTISEFYTVESTSGDTTWVSGDQVLATTKKDHFRTILARFGHAYLENQLYGGSSLVTLQQDGRQISVRLDLANSHHDGFSLRATRTEAPNKAEISSLIPPRVD